MQSLKMSVSFTNSTLFTSPLYRSTLSRTNRTPSTIIRMGGGPRTFPGGVSKWEWKRMQAKKSKQLLKARLARERQIYEMRKRAELKAAVAHLERPWERVQDVDGDGRRGGARTPTLFSVSADEQVKVLADRFRKPGGFDLWTDNDGPQLFKGGLGNPTVDVVRDSGTGGRETSRFINGWGKGRGKSRVGTDGGIVGSGVRNGGSETRVESRVKNGGSLPRVGSRVNLSSGNDTIVENRVNLSSGNDTIVENRARNLGSGGRESQVSNIRSGQRIGARVSFNRVCEKGVERWVRNGESGKRVGGQVKYNGWSGQGVESGVRNEGGRSFGKIGVFRKMDYSKSKAYEMRLEGDGYYGYQGMGEEEDTSS